MSRSLAISQKFSSQRPAEMPAVGVIASGLPASGPSGYWSIMAPALRPPFPPMEALSVDDIPTGEEWQYEPKWDGFRCLVFRDGNKVELQSKSGQSLTRYFPELVEAVRSVKATAFVLDGEIVVPVDAAFSFDALLQRIHPAQSRVQRLAAETPALLIVFDLLAGADGKPLIGRPLRQRRPELEGFAHKWLRGVAPIRLSPATTKLSEAKSWLKRVGATLDGIAPLGHDAIERSAHALEPALGLGELRGCGRHPDARHAAQPFMCEGFEFRPALAQWSLDQRLAIGVRQEIEHDEERRRFRRELLHAALRWMDPLQQGIERKRPIDRNDDLPIEDECRGLDAAYRVDQLREIARQRLARFRLQLDLVAVAEDEAAEAIPFRLVLPFLPGRDVVDRQGFHRWEWRTQCRSHDRPVSARP